MGSSRARRVTWLCRKALRYLDEDRPDDALIYTKRALRLDGDHYYANYLMGDLIQFKDPDRAIIHLRKAVKSNPQLQSAWAIPGSLLGGRDERLQEAVEILKIAYALDPSDLWTVLLLANRSYTIGNIDLSRKLFLEAKSLRPNDEEIQEYYQDFERWVAERN